MFKILFKKLSVSPLIVVFVILAVGFFALKYLQLPPEEAKDGASTTQNKINDETTNMNIGGDRDEHGCLIPAGYAYDENVGACIRAFELTPDIMKAAKMAVDYVGKGYALTVVAFNSYEEVGAYDIMFERGVERTKQTVYIKNWQVKK